MAVNLRQTHFRFGIEELLEATHGWLANEDTNIAIAPATTFLLRFTEQEIGGTGINNVDAQFQYNKNGAGWVNITTSSAVVKAVASVAFTNGQNCTKRLSGTGTFESSAAGCTEDGTSGGTTNDIAASGNSETECALQIVNADVNGEDIIQFRITSPDTTIGYDVTPQLTVLKAVALLPAEATQTQNVAEAALTQLHVLAPQECAQGQAIAAPILTQVHVLMAQECAQAQAVANATIEEQAAAIDLVPAEVAQGQAVAEAALTQVHVVAPQESNQGQVIDTPELTQVHELGPQEANQGQGVEAPAITQIHMLGPQEENQGQSIDAPALTQVHTLVPQELEQSQGLDTPELSQVHNLIPGENIQAQSIETPTIEEILGGVIDLMPDENHQEQLSQEALIYLTFILEVQKGRQAQKIDSPALTYDAGQSAIFLIERGRHEFEVRTIGGR